MLACIFFDFFLCGDRREHVWLDFKVEMSETVGRNLMCQVMRECWQESANRVRCQRPPEVVVFPGRDIGFFWETFHVECEIARDRSLDFHFDGQVSLSLS